MGPRGCGHSCLAAPSFLPLKSPPLHTWAAKVVSTRPCVVWAQSLGGLLPTSCSLTPALQSLRRPCGHSSAPTQPAEGLGEHQLLAAESAPAASKQPGWAALRSAWVLGRVEAWRGRMDSLLCFLLPLTDFLVGSDQKPRHLPGPQSLSWCMGPLGW